MDPFWIVKYYLLLNYQISAEPSPQEKYAKMCIFKDTYWKSFSPICGLLESQWTRLTNTVGGGFLRRTPDKTFVSLQRGPVYYCTLPDSSHNNIKCWKLQNKVTQKSIIIQVTEVTSHLRKWQPFNSLSYLSYIYLGYFVCLCVIVCVCVCVCVTIAERSAILLVLVIKLTKEMRRRAWRGRD
jgi:hypothetical protein